MKWLLVAALPALIFAQEGSRPLFNGKDLSDFQVDTASLWRVENGVIIGKSPGIPYNEFLRTRKHYSDFVLKLEFKMTDPSGKGNSGIQFRSKETDPPSHEVVGFQADMGQQYWGCLYDESRRKRVLAQARPEALAALRKDDWNTYEIEARGNRIVLRLNGVVSVDYLETEPGIDTRGFIALQLHSGPPLEMQFRNLRIRELAATMPVSAQYSSRQQETWLFDRLDRIGGHPTRILGDPKIIDSPLGKAVAFDGVDDAIFFDVHPLAGAKTFTWEVIFRPDSGGNPEQRFFHLQERDAVSGEDTQNRLLFETRLTGSSWYLDSFVFSSAGSRALIDPQKKHPLDRWYHIAMVYDGAEYRHYVNHVLQGSATIPFAPHQPGRASAGVRINLRDYFKGAIRTARFSRSALAPSDFLPAPLK